MPTTATINKIKNWSIYKITNPENSTYIGRTIKADRRISNHLPTRNKKKGRRNSYLLESIKNFGVENHKVEILEKFTSDINYANSKEIFWIKTYMSNRNIYPEMNGFNLTKGGIGFSGNHTKISKDKMSLSHIGLVRTKEHSKKMVENKKKPVLKYDLNMILINEYPSVREANISIGGSVGGGSISAVCKGKLKQAKGFIFRYKHNKPN